ncbi:hypothetical protein A3J90_01215 [candidate division WOR-1 bacterium RIFOXYC2_FULL_37_10]|uniref:Uncharacterized protein n=1 Tax=candidate division WOR-1 bacterium RIFOXYB2_FULL_37_13 TaxID=1802579 RepID=A0A1F4SSX3_UNCSA|nr:MAG: hypothetical protein A2246_01140 [candidate division WOR-1 bacterium RIFOXYA2_FULL_37_7]OGC23528.1 MAG: hypothetical protein A2310_02880 [candidate division WOR-1 bacterium RIFOXYB2_FULL_37_13]OGC35741.1 MAG: hypothetical protein A3J90_01215 [candidate division WOR-1 bacterium RIFOXYC2_FULL_37_10]
MSYGISARIGDSGQIRWGRQRVIKNMLCRLPRRAYLKLMENDPINRETGVPLPATRAVGKFLLNEFSRINRDGAQTQEEISEGKNYEEIQHIAKIVATIGDLFCLKMLSDLNKKYPDAPIYSSVENLLWMNGLLDLVSPNKNLKHW